MNMKDAVILTTGSATGVGAEVAQQCAAKGAKVVINYTKSLAEAEETKAACEALGAETLLVQADVSSDEDCKRMVAETLEKWGQVDGLVNNAGRSTFAAHHDLDALTAEDFQKIYAVNVIGSYQMIRAVTPAMKEQGKGAVVNVSSVAGVLGVGSSVAYAASKGALNTMTVSLARALGPEIRINAVCPGMIETRWLKEGLGDDLYNMQKQAVQSITPLKDVSSPVEVAEPIVWLLEGADHITGETLMVDCGMHLNYAPLVAR